MAPVSVLVRREGNQVTSRSRTVLALSLLPLVLLALWFTLTGRGEAIPGARLMDAVAAPVKHLAWSPDGRLLAGALADGSYVLWNAETGRALRDLRGPYRGGDGVGLAFTADGKHVLVEQTARRMAPNGYFSVLGAWNVEDGAVTDIFGPSTARSYSVSQSDQRVFTLYERGEVIVYDARTWQPVQLWKADPAAVRGLAVHPTGAFIAVAGVMQCPRGLPPARLWLYDVKNIPPMPFVAAPAAVIDNAHQDGVSIRVAWLGNERIVSVANQVSGNGTDCEGRANTTREADHLVVWQAQDGKKARALPIGISTVESLAPRADGRVIAIASSSSEGGPGTVQIVDVESGQVLATWGGPEASYTAASFSPNGELIAAGRTRSSTLHALLTPIARLFGDDATAWLASLFASKAEVLVTTLNANTATP